MSKRPKITVEEVIMIRSAVNLQLAQLRELQARALDRKPRHDKAEVNFYKSRIEKWEPFAAKINEPFDRADLARKLQDGGWNSDEEEEDSE